MAPMSIPRLEAEDQRRLLRIARRIDQTLAGFIRGQGTVCLILIFYYAITLSLVGLKFGFVIGLLSGALSFIPFVGAIFGAVASIGLATVQFWPDQMISIAIVTFDDMIVVDTLRSFTHS